MNPPSDRAKPPPIPSEPPRKLDNDYVRAALKAIKETQAEQAHIESERAGAAKYRNRLLTVFGGVMTAAAIGVFGWMWHADKTIDAHTSKITQLSTNPARPHGHASLASEQRATQKQVNGLQGSHEALTERLDNNATAQNEKLDNILNAVRHGNAQRRTWGN